MDVIYAPGSPGGNDTPVIDDTPTVPGGVTPNYQVGSRWTGSTASGSTGSTGQGITLTYSIVPDGTLLTSGQGEPNLGSDLRAKLDGIYGSSATWLPIVQQVFSEWSAISGITYIYEPNDDGAQMSSGAAGVLGVRGDVRIGAHPIDGASNILAYNYFPNFSDMTLDSSDLSGGGFMSSTNSLALRNVMAHEHGHGLGFNHVDPINQTKLMEAFASLAFDGPQYDDMVAVNRNYGDFYEKAGGNNTSATATDRGTLANGTDFINNLSLATTSDSDFFKFTLSQTKLINLTAAPFGPTYLQGPQNGTTTTFNGMAQMDLQLQLLASNGSTVLATANANGVGLSESLGNRTLAAGTYYIKVSPAPGAANSAQMYNLTTNLSTTLGVWTAEGDGTTWTQAANWSLATLPGPSDDAVISVAGTANILISSGAQSVRSLVCDENLTISGGSLSLDQPSTMNGSLTLSGGMLSGAGDITLKNSTNTWSAGAMTGAGKTIIDAGGGLTVAGTGVDKTLSRVLQNVGTITYATNRLVFNNGSVNNLSNGIFNASASDGFIDGGGTNSFTTAGTLNKSGGSTFTADLPLDVATGGTLRVMGGTLILPRTGTIRGNASADSGATLRFNGPYSIETGGLLFGVGAIRVADTLTWNAGSMASPGGTIFILGTGTLAIAGAAKSTNRNFDLAGTLTGPSDLTATGAFNWNAGGTMSGAGKLIIGSAGSLNIPGSGDRVSTRPITMQGSGSLDPGGALIVHLASLLMTGAAATLDLMDNTLIVDTDSATILGYYNNGVTLGNRITSSMLGVDSDHGLGVALATDLFSSFPATFLTQSIDSGATIVRYTINGDASLDRTVDTVDFNLMASNFSGTGKRWSQGDFNYDGSVDTVDFNQLASHFGQTLPAPSPLGVASSAAMSPAIFSTSPIPSSHEQADQDTDVLPA